MSLKNDGKTPTDQLSRPLRDLRISVTDQCNFRCAYCMPKEVFGLDYPFLPKNEILTNEEVYKLALSFAELGIEKIRLTGGEPLLRKNLVPLVRILSQIDLVKDLSLTTNGTLLPRYAKGLKESGLNRINISLDGLSPIVFKAMSGGRGEPAAVLEGIEAAQQADLEVKVNMVVKKGVNEEEVLPMVRFFRDKRITLRFIEYMDVGNSNQWRSKEVLPAKEILDTIAKEFPFHPIDPNYKGEVAARYRYSDIPAEFGLINSITKPFCSDCNRARLSANGNLYTCLFATSGHDLKTIVKSGVSQSELTKHISGIWTSRKDQYSKDRSSQTISQKKIEMSYIGG
ncbi:MAG TPA: GTP 3',8-cyclase MoaA [Opitutae bacterium]|nr:GTP 3',8-cyclase MoaA [Opitutae bacterium]